MGLSPAKSKVNRITGKLHNRKPHHSEYGRVTGAGVNVTESGCLEGRRGHNRAEWVQIIQGALELSGEVRSSPSHLRWSATEVAGVVPNSAPCQIMHPLVLVGLSVGVGEGLGLGVGLGLGNQVAFSMRGCIIWQGCRFWHNTGRVRESINGQTPICATVRQAPTRAALNRKDLSIMKPQRVTCTNLDTSKYSPERRCRHVTAFITLPKSPKSHYSRSVASELNVSADLC